MIDENLKRNSILGKFSYNKITNLSKGKKLLNNFNNLLQNNLNTIVYNFVDTLSHARTDMEVIKEDYKYFILLKSGKFSRTYTSKYKDSDFIASYRVLTKNDLIGLTSHKLKLLRNEIFARKGYIFKSKELNEYFLQKEWYKPIYSNSNFLLNPIEEYNIKLIKSFED